MGSAAKTDTVFHIPDLLFPVCKKQIQVSISYVGQSDSSANKMTPEDPQKPPGVFAPFSVIFLTAMVAYLKPPSISFPSLDLVVSVLYSVVPPAVNPLIYSMRNQELKDAIRKLISWMFLNSDKFPIFVHK
ncbi:olfactory receptor 14C36-like [Grus japonensis]|uniref:Olfactory receptor 14C36-like n=1 Tax=Grus japonensis TaxID=30415 RepID=A0ABC9XAR9_GRUJA